jgi:hypothetical protein
MTRTSENGNDAMMTRYLRRFTLVPLMLAGSVSSANANDPNCSWKRVSLESFEVSASGFNVAVGVHGTNSTCKNIGDRFECVQMETSNSSMIVVEFSKVDSADSKTVCAISIPALLESDADWERALLDECAKPSLEACTRFVETAAARKGESLVVVDGAIPCWVGVIGSLRRATEECILLMRLFPNQTGLSECGKYVREVAIDGVKQCSEPSKSK